MRRSALILLGFCWFALAFEFRLGRAQIILRVLEEQPIGSRVIRVSDLLRNATELRRVRPGKPTLLRNGTHFKLDDDGWLSVALRIDRETLCPSPMATPSCQMPLLLNVPVATGDPIVVKVRVDVLDVDDNLPTWNVTDRRRVPLEFYEHAPIGSEFFVARTIDSDIVSTRTLRYTAVDQLAAFAVRATQSRAQTHVTDVYLVLRRDLDRESLDQFDVQVCARDELSVDSEADLHASRCIVVNVSLLDINDNPPVIANTNVSVSVDEDESVGGTLLRLLATDRDAGANAELEFRFSPLTRPLHAALFAIDQQGVLSLRSALDYETSRSHKLFVEVFDRSQFPVTSTATVHITVNDVIDEFPEVDLQPWIAIDSSVEPQQPANSSRLVRTKLINLQLEENNAVRIPIADVRVSDADAADYGRLHCSTDQEAPATRQMAVFDFSPLIADQNFDFALSLNTSIDRERSSHLQVKLICRDNGWPPRTSIAIVNIRITDVNDNSPIFSKSHYHATVSEAATPNDPLLQVLAHDADAGFNGTVRYRIDTVSARHAYSGNANNQSLPDDSHFSNMFEPSRSPFAIDNQTGSIRLVNKLDHETFTTWRLRVSAVDFGSPSRTGTSMVTVLVLDTNDNAPTFASTGYYFRVPENILIGTVVGEIRATDPDGNQNQEVEHTIDTTGNPGGVRIPFVLDIRSGRLRVNAPIDREQVSSYRFTVVARDRGTPPQTSSASVVCDILDENDSTPVFIQPREGTGPLAVNITEPLAIGIPFVFVRATDADTEANGRVIYSIRHVTVASLRRLDPTYRRFDSQVQVQVPSSALLSSVADAEEDSQLELFTVDLLNGELVIRREIRPSDNWKFYEVVVEAADQADFPRFTTTTVHIELRIDDDLLARSYLPATGDNSANRGVRIDHQTSIIYDRANMIVLLAACCVVILVIIVVLVVFAKPLCSSNFCGEGSRKRPRRTTRGAKRSSVDPGPSNLSGRRGRYSRRAHSEAADEPKCLLVECERLVPPRRTEDCATNEAFRFPKVAGSADTETDAETETDLESYLGHSVSRFRSLTVDQVQQGACKSQKPVHDVCDSLLEFMQLRNSPAQSHSQSQSQAQAQPQPVEKERAEFEEEDPNQKLDRCALCKSNTIGELSKVKKVFNEWSPRSADTQAPSHQHQHLLCLESSFHSDPVTVTGSNPPSSKGQPQSDDYKRPLPHSVSYCDEYRPVQAQPTDSDQHRDLNDSISTLDQNLDGSQTEAHRYINSPDLKVYLDAGSPSSFDPLDRDDSVIYVNISSDLAEASV